MQRRALSDQPPQGTLEATPSQPTPSATPLVTQGISGREQGSSARVQESTASSSSAREETSISALEETGRRRQDESTCPATELQPSSKEPYAPVLERVQRQRPELPAADGAADAGGGGAVKWGSRRSALEGVGGSRSEGVGGSRSTASDASLQESLAEHYYRYQLYLLYLLY